MIAAVISSSVGRYASSSMSGRCALLSIAACEIMDGRFSTSLKCSAHRSSVRLGSVSRVSASALNIDEEQHMNVHVSTVLPIEQQMNVHVSMSLTIEQMMNVHVSPAIPIGQQMNVHVSNAIPLGQQMNVHVSTVLSTEQHMNVCM